MSQLPTIKRSKSWVSSTFQLTKEDLSKLTPDEEGKYTIAVLNDPDLLLQILQKLELHSRILGTHTISLELDGEKLYTYLFRLMRQRLNKKDFPELCELLSRVSSAQFRALKEFWDFKPTPKMVIQALSSYSIEFGKAAPRIYYSAIANLQWIADHPVTSLPFSN